MESLFKWSINSRRQHIATVIRRHRNMNPYDPPLTVRSNELDRTRCCPICGSDCGRWKLPVRSVRRHNCGTKLGRKLHHIVHAVVFISLMACTSFRICCRQCNLPSSYAFCTFHDLLANRGLDGPAVALQSVSFLNRVGGGGRDRGTSRGPKESKSDKKVVHPSPRKHFVDGDSSARTG